MTYKYDNKIVYLSLFVLVLFFLQLGGYPLFDVDEGAFSEATRQMSVRHDYITPWLNGEPRFDKPVLIYWAQSLGLWLFGVSEWAFRLPSALAASVWCLLPFFFLRQRRDEEAGWVAAVLLATALGVQIIGRSATADALLNVLLVATMLDVYRFYESGHRSLLLRVYLWMGLGVLTKGPVAILIPLAVSFLFFVSLGQWRQWLRAVFCPAGWALFLLIVLPWYVLEYLREGQAFIDGFFMRHNVERFSSTMEQHGGSLIYYVVVLPLLLLPFSSWFVLALTRLRAGWGDPLQRFLLLWFGFVVVFFSLSGTKLPHYVLYGVTPMLMLMAWQRKALRARLHLLPGLLFLLLVLALPWIVASLQIRDAHVSALLSQPQAVFGGSYLWLAGVFLVLGLVAAFWPRLQRWHNLLLLGVVQALMVVLLLLPAAGRLQQQPVVAAAQFAEQHRLPVVMWRVNWPTFNVYSQLSTPRRDPQAGEVVLTMQRHLADLPGHEVLFAERGVVLARVPGVAEP